MPHFSIVPVLKLSISTSAVREQLHQHVAALGLGEVEGDGALVAVDAGEVGGDAFLVERRAP
jgi:hypothetical protein